MTLDLIPRLILGDLDLTDYPFGVEFGSDFGMAQNIVKVLESGLDDGEIEVVSGVGNRTFTIPLLVEASDLNASQLAETLLATECAKDVNEFRIDPGDGFAAVTVFHTFRPQWGYQRDDKLEQNGYRRYTLSIPALPFGFSEDEVTDVAVPFTGTPTTEVISDGTSTTGWSTTAPGAVSTSGGKLRVSYFASSASSAGFGYTRTAYRFTAAKVLSPVVDFTDTEYVTADVATENASPVFSASVDGVALQQVSMTLLSQTASVYTYRVTWRCRDTSASLLTIGAVGYTLLLAGEFPAGDPTLVIDNVQRSNVVPTPVDANGHKSLREIPVTGSARTAGSAIIEHETTGLGDVLFYTSSNLGVGYDPDMDRWFDPASASSGADATTLSGLSVSISGLDVDNGADWNPPANMLPPGPHLLMAQVKSTLAATITWTASTVVGGVLMAVQTGTVEVAATGDGYVMVPLGVATLPTIKVPAEGTAVVRINLTSDQFSFVGGLLSYFIGDGSDLTHVKAGAGTPELGTVHNRLHLEAASISNGGSPGIFVGVAENGSDAYDPGYPMVQSWGRHPMVPPVTLAHLVTTAASNARLTLRHRPAWFTHAGQ